MMNRPSVGQARQVTADVWMNLLQITLTMAMFKEKCKQRTEIEHHLLLPKIVANLVNKDNVVSLGDRKSIRLRAERKSLRRTVSATSFD